MRLIDADALLKSAGIFEAKMAARGCGKSILHLAKVWLFNEVNKAPTIDAVEVVRCRECKYYSEKNSECEHERWMDAEGWNKDVDPDEFCSRGERISDV